MQITRMFWIAALTLKVVECLNSSDFVLVVPVIVPESVAANNPTQPPPRDCNQFPDPGTCGSHTERYYFQEFTGKCISFTYSGCGGNSNNFLNQNECLEYCTYIQPEAQPVIIPMVFKSTPSESTSAVPATKTTAPSTTTKPPTTTTTTPSTTTTLVPTTSETPTPPFQIQSQYSAIIVENSVEPLLLVPPMIVDRRVCEIEISDEKRPSFRFELNLSKNEIVVLPTLPLDCEDQRTYHFDITLTDCSEKRQVSNTAEVFLTLQDVNEHAPKFPTKSYNFSILSGERVNEVIEVVDEDCGWLFSSICDVSKANIGKPSAIFPKITEGAVLLTSRSPFIYAPDKHTYVFELNATDCGGLESEPSTVTVNVLPPCDLAWKGIEDVLVEYDKPVCLLPNVELSECHLTCTNITVEAAIENCQKESIMNTIDRCEHWGSNVLKPIDGYIGQQVLKFDGKMNELIIQPPEIDLPETFGFSLWFQYDNSTSPEEKKTLICEGDHYRKNRHHFQLYIHKCNIGLIWRKKMGDNDTTRMRLTESYFHWQTPMICTSQWHHVILNVNGHDDVTLLVDGLVPEVQTGIKMDNLLVDIGEPVSWSIGACWKATENKFIQFYAGLLASVKYIAHDNFPVLECKQLCTEFLTYLPAEHSQNHSKLDHWSGGLKKDQKVMIKSVTKEDMREMSANVHYVNENSHMDARSTRDVSINTKASCIDHKRNRKQYQSFFQISVKPQVRNDSPDIELKMPVTFFAYSKMSLKSSVRLFPALSFQMNKRDKSETTINDCSIIIAPALQQAGDPYETEGLSLMQSEENIPITFLEGKNGAILQGPSSAAIFENVLNDVFFYSKLSIGVETRNVSVKCTGDYGMSSNIVNLTITSSDSRNRKSERPERRYYHQDPTLAMADRSNQFLDLPPDSSMQMSDDKMTEQLAALTGGIRKAKFTDNSVQSLNDTYVYIYGLSFIAVLSFVVIISFAVYRSQRANRRLASRMNHSFFPGTKHWNEINRPADFEGDYLTITENPSPLPPIPHFLQNPGFASGRFASKSFNCDLAMSSRDSTSKNVKKPGNIYAVVGSQSFDENSQLPEIDNGVLNVDTDAVEDCYFDEDDFEECEEALYKIKKRLEILESNC